MIAQAEAFAMLVARVAYRSTLMDRRAIFFVDNEWCRYSCIKALSDSPSLMRVVQLFHQSSEIDRALMWVERVPSSSNIADLPSRQLQHQAASMIGGQVVTPPLDLEALAAMCSDLTSLPSFAFGDNNHISSFLSDLPDGALFGE